MNGIKVRSVLVHQAEKANQHDRHAANMAEIPPHRIRSDDDIVFSLLKSFHYKQIVTSDEGRITPKNECFALRRILSLWRFVHVHRRSKTAHLR